MPGWMSRKKSIAGGMAAVTAPLAAAHATVRMTVSFRDPASFAY